jgi:signal transduction histidine kinase
MLRPGGLDVVDVARWRRSRPLAPEWVRAARIVASGVLLAAIVGILGWGLEGRRFGYTDAETAARIRREVERRVGEVLEDLRGVAALVAARADLVAPPTVDSERTRQLFDHISRALARHPDLEMAATVYGPSGVALAWGGRPSEIPQERLGGSDRVFAAPAPLGLRLFLVQPLWDAELAGGTRRRVGTIAVEGALAPPAGVVPLLGDTFRLRTSLMEVPLRPASSTEPDARAPASFLVRGPRGEPLVEGRLPPDRLSAVRRQWRRGVVGVVGQLLAVTALLVVGPVLDRRRRVRHPGRYAAWTALAVALVAAARAACYLAMPPAWVAHPLSGVTVSGAREPGLIWRSPFDLVLTSLALAAVLALVAPGVGRLRLVARRAARGARPWVRWSGQVVAGVVVALVLAGHESLLRRIVEATRVDTLRFSLHPWEAERLSLIAGVLCLAVAAVWAAALVFAAGAAWLVPSERRHRTLVLVAWLVPTAAVVTLGRFAGLDRSWVALALGAVLPAAAALAARRALAWYRHATQASRLIALFATVLVPALVFYPAVFHHTDAAKRRLIEREFAVQPAAHPAELQTRLERSLRQIDQIPDLAALVAGPAPVGPPPTEPAFRIWSGTALAEARLTSAVELYGPDGRLVSRFALNLPEYTALAQHYEAHACRWEIFGEAAPFGAEERRILHAERQVCDARGRSLGSLVVHVMLDYRALPFLTSQGPYQQVLRPSPGSSDEASRAGDVELVIYGWGLSPIYTSGPGAWPIDAALFRRLYDPARRPFWTDLRKGGVLYHVHFSNDRGGIYAIGYPALTAVDHLERLAELVTLAGLAYVVVLLGAALFGRLARARTPARLLREIRASFYRKLFLAFVLASAVPVVTLALVVREYFATKLRTDAEAQAVRTAAVARRVIEEFAALQRGAGPPVPPTDDVMVLISQLIDQDVHIFEGPRLLATSERDLFASGLLPQRTPAELYRAIQLDGLPSFVGEDRLGAVRYLMAAAPVRTGAQPAILAVPFALRQREIEKEIDELDRGILLAALVFILLGAAIGASMAERIADPVRRLTRATRRIARGDFDARILGRSRDELQRLVDAFNTMASELKAQAAQLERTHRLEAWAEMARQVAHEIKNPLTPIQLSAEHLRRVHADRGEPLSPVLDNCVETILRQVALLRQIAAEFSAFASPPAPRPAPVSVAELVEDVVLPYRTGLGDRIQLEMVVAPDLPRVQVDRTLVARALVNVVENALHAMPGRGVLRIVAERDGEGVRLTVADTGVGMDPEALARVFEPYFSTKASGTGLGLTIAKRNLESHGGRITVESARGRGTTVTLWLPASPEGTPA